MSAALSIPGAGASASSLNISRADTRFLLTLDVRELLSPAQLADLAARAEAEHTTEARLMRRMLAEDLRNEPPATLNDSPPPPPVPDVRLKPAHARALRKFAGMLEVTPEELLSWELEDGLNDLNDPRSGMLEEWANGMISYESPESEKRVKSRVAAWTKRYTAVKASAVEGRAKA